MKLILSLVFVLSILGSTCFGQVTPISNPYYFLKYIKVKDSIQANIYRQGGDTLATKKYVREHSADLSFNGQRTITRSGVPNINVGGSDLKGFVENFFFPSTSPQINLQSDTTLEYQSSGDSLISISAWSAVRPTACLAISSITINSKSIPLDSPFAEGHTQSGTFSFKFPRNINSVLNASINSVDKSSSTVRNYNFMWRYYWGSFSSSVPPTDAGFSISDAQILALSGSSSTSGSALTNTRVRNFNGINGNGRYLVFAFPLSWGNPIFVINGLTNTSYVRVRNGSFINALGGTTLYQVWVSSTTMNAAISQFDIK